MNEIKLGKYTEEKLVQAFGTPAQIKKWKEENRFIGSAKSTFLKRANKYAKIKDMGNNTYYVSKIYDYPIPTNFDKMNSSLYQYIIPLLLDRVQKDTVQLNYSFGKWARELKMVNSNYSLIEYNKETAAKILEKDVNRLYDYYRRTDEMIEYYFSKAFDYLDSLTYFSHQNSYMIIKESITEAEIQGDGDILLEVTLESSRLATEEEIQIYNKCVAVADTEAEINHVNERYYSHKAKKWHEILNTELRQYNIVKVYKCHQLYITHPDGCIALRDMFGKKSEKTLIKKLTDEFADKITENAEKRNDSPEYVQFFSDMCDLVIDPKSDKSLYGKIKPIGRKINITDKYVKTK